MIHPQSFSVTYRNYGHWDFTTKDGRAFRLRGSGQNWQAMDERVRPYPITKFKSFVLAVAFIAEQLMLEDLIPDGENNKPANTLPGTN